MGNNKLLQVLVSYKKACALMAAFDLGIYERLLSTPADAIELAENCHVDKEVVGCFLEYMRVEGIMDEKNGFWRITKDFSCQIKDLESYRHIIKHENNIYKQWVTPEKIANSVRTGIGNRDFDLEGFSSEDKTIYSRAMYGDNLNLIAFYIRRALPGRKAIECLEYGRSMGELSTVLQRIFPKFSATLSVDMSFSSIMDQSVIPRFTQKPKVTFNKDDSVYDTKYDLICIINTIHYYQKNHALKLLRRLKQSMRSDARLCICDLFYDKDDAFKSSWILDWITHGGIYTLTVKELLALLKEAGFGEIEHRYIDGISTDMFLAY